MKIIIVLKKIDADGLGGELLSESGLVRSKHEPQVFARVLPSHEVSEIGLGNGSWSTPEHHTQSIVETLMDYGIRPLRVFQHTNSAAGLTPLHASMEEAACEGCDDPDCVCKWDGPCEGCGEVECMCEFMEDVKDPYDYLDELEKRYKEAGVEPVSSRKMDLEEWLDTQAALYELEGRPEGVSYVDRLEGHRERMLGERKQLEAAAAEVEHAVDMLLIESLLED